MRRRRPRHFRSVGVYEPEVDCTRITSDVLVLPFSPCLFFLFHISDPSSSSSRHYYTYIPHTCICMGHCLRAIRTGLDIYNAAASSESVHFHEALVCLCTTTSSLSILPSSFLLLLFYTRGEREREGFLLGWERQKGFILFSS